MDQGNAIPELVLQVPVVRGRPRLGATRDLAQELHAKVAAHLVEHTVPRAYSLMCKAIDQGHTFIAAGRAPTREHMKAQQDALRLAGFREPDKARDDRDLVDMSLAQLTAIIREKEASLRVISEQPSAQDIEKLI